MRMRRRMKPQGGLGRRKVRPVERGGRGVEERETRLPRMRVAKEGRAQMRMGQKKVEPEGRKRESMIFRVR